MDRLLHIPTPPFAPLDGELAPGAAPDAPHGGTRGFLDETIRSLAREFKADRASLFLYDDAAGTATLRACVGYPMFGKATIVLRLGEGLVGRVLAERRPIYSEMASSMRGYLQHPNFPDADMQTFLGIPLLRGRERVGAVSLRRRTGHPFLADEISAARAKVAELTDAVQSAGALLLAESRPAARKGELRPGEQMVFRGTAVSNGWAMGPVHVSTPAALARLLGRPEPGAAPVEFPPAVRPLGDAVRIVEESLRGLASELDKKLPEAASMILEADMMMLHDESFAGRIAKAVEGGATLPAAVARVASDYIAIFEDSDNDYMREKARDVEDLAIRLLDAVVSENPGAPEASRASSIVVAEKMLPSDVLRVARDRVAGIVLCAGGATAHVTLLVRSLRIPMIVVKSRDLLRLAEGETLILDCANDTVYVHPDAGLAERFRNRAGEEAAESRRLQGARPETRTADGVRVTLEANVNILADLDTAVAAKAEGVGLYRTEFPFLMRPSMPTEADQFAIYSRVLERMGGAPVVFRTLDAGGDKAIPYLYRGQEENPALGLRSIRFSLKYPYILDQQLRAILRAVQKSGNEQVGIMFPMISSVEEFRAAREHVETCLAALQNEIGDKDLLAPAVGTMVEVPAIVGVLDAVAEESDFLSIGTNDLIQYTLAVDRTNAAVASSYVAHHPAVLRLLRMISTIAARHGTPVSVCGEMGRDPRYMPFLLGIGIRTFSLEPAQIPRCQELVSRCTVPACEAYARDLLSLSAIADIEARIDEFSRATFG